MPAKRSVFMNRQEITSIQDYIKKLFGCPGLSVKERPGKRDSAEVYIENEFIGVIFRDDEDGDVSYNFNMAILEMDIFPDR